MDGTYDVALGLTVPLWFGRTAAAGGEARAGRDLAEAEYDKQTRIIVLDVGGELMGFIVDAVSEVIRISSSEIQPSPAVVTSGVDQECIAGVINQAERLLVLLELEKMFTQDERQLFKNL
jgi:purine-binding chemotaxis protein CheW